MASSDLKALQNHYFCLQQMNPKKISAKLIIIIIIIKSCCTYSLLCLQSKSIITKPYAQISSFQNLKKPQRQNH
jgi:hypothetical protein